MNELLKILTSDAPSCLEKFELTPTEIKSSSGMPFRDEFVHALLNCKCGADKFFASACRIEEMVGFFKKKSVVFYSGPVRLACGHCGISTLVFEPDKHGWNGEMDMRSGLLEAADIEPELSACFSEPGAIAVCYSFQGLDNYQELVDDDEITNPQDFFDTFEITISFDGLKKFREITSHECA